MTVAWPIGDVACDNTDSIFPPGPISWSLSFCRGSHVEGRGSRVIFFSGFVVLLLAVGSIFAAQSSPVYMFFPDLVKCKYIIDLIIYL